MPMTKEEKAVKRAAHYQNNKEKCKAAQKAYSEANKEKISADKKVYYEENKEKCKAYQHTPQGKKSNRIVNWKRMGIISDDYDALYENYLATIVCDDCKRVLTEDKRTTSTTRCMDHCHQTGLPRGVVCNACNVKRG